MDNVEIVKLMPGEWEKYKEFRLNASEEDPLAWGVTLEEESAYPDEWWREQLEKVDQKAGRWILFAKVEEQIVGMVAANQIKRLKMNHIAHIDSVSVKNEFRGRGIASQLMRALLDKLSNEPNIFVAQMGVSSAQTAAISLYKKFGFEVAGTRKKVFNNEGKFYDEVLMERMLRD